MSLISTYENPWQYEMPIYNKVITEKEIYSLDESYSVTIFQSRDIGFWGYPCLNKVGSKKARIKWDPLKVNVTAASIYIDIKQEVGTTFTLEFNGYNVWSNTRMVSWEPGKITDTVDILSYLLNGDNDFNFRYHIDVGFYKPGIINSITLRFTLQSLDPEIPPTPEEPPHVLPPSIQEWIKENAVLIGLGIVGVVTVYMIKKQPIIIVGGKR